MNFKRIHFKRELFCEAKRLHVALDIVQTHNARQLEAWCLHFIATNYAAFQRRREWAQLTGEHRAHMEEHRWPPQAYLEALKRHKKECAKLDSQCSVM